MGHWVGAQGLEKVAKNAKTPPLYVVIPRKSQIQNKKNVFQSQVENLLNP